MKNKISWLVAIIASIILLQTLFFKFSAAPESVYIFSKLGIEPWGRIGSGIAELIASILLLVPATRGIGGLLGMGIMAGAIASHLTVLGIEVMDDNGLLFLYACITFICCTIAAWLHKNTIPVISGFFKPSTINK